MGSLRVELEEFWGQSTAKRFFHKKGIVSSSHFDLCCELLMLLHCEPVANVVDLVVPVEPLFVGQSDEAFDKFASP